MHGSGAKDHTEISFEGAWWRLGLRVDNRALFPAYSSSVILDQLPEFSLINQQTHSQLSLLPQIQPDTAMVRFTPEARAACERRAMDKQLKSTRRFKSKMESGKFSIVDLLRAEGELRLANLEVGRCSAAAGCTSPQGSTLLPSASRSCSHSSIW